MTKDEMRHTSKLIAQLQEDFRWDGTDDRISPALAKAYRTVISDLVRNLGTVKPENMDGIDERLNL